MPPSQRLPHRHCRPVAQHWGPHRARGPISQRADRAEDGDGDEEGGVGEEADRRRADEVGEERVGNNVECGGDHGTEHGVGALPASAGTRIDRF